LHAKREINNRARDNKKRAAAAASPQDTGAANLTVKFMTKSRYTGGGAQPEIWLQVWGHRERRYEMGRFMLCIKEGELHV
jgi:hypothetical protein